MNKNLAKVARMTHDEKLEFFVNGRITVGSMTQVVEGRLKTFYHAKVRGFPIKGDVWRYDTPEKANEFGKQVMQKWKDELEKIKSKNG